MTTSIEHRPLTEDERDSVQALNASHSGFAANFLLGAFVFVVAYIPVIWAMSKLGVHDKRWFWIPFGLGIALALAVIVRIRATEKHYGGLHDSDLEDGRAELATYEITDAIRIEELEDEGSAYYLRLSQGGVLFLGGQYLYEPEEEGIFPSTRLRTIRTARTRTLLDLEILGEPLSPSATRGPFPLEDHEEGRVPEDGDLLDVELDAWPD